jgi:hypothetical protein
VNTPAKIGIGALAAIALGGALGAAGDTNASPPTHSQYEPANLVHPSHNSQPWTTVTTIAPVPLSSVPTQTPCFPVPCAPYTETSKGLK